MTCVVIDMAAYRAGRDQRAIRRHYAAQTRQTKRPTINQVLGFDLWPGPGGDAA